MSILSLPKRAAFCLLPIFLLAACKHEPKVVPVATDDGFPDHIGAILVNRCATAGCHNDASSMNAKGLNLTSWQKLFAGAASGSVIVPYNTENSSLLHFVNLYNDGDPKAAPKMPYNPENPDAPINPLTREEYAALREWVLTGAPGKSGEAPFASEADTRQKIYCTMQGCDLVGVLDAETQLVMRYIPVGKTSGIESPHCVRVSPDGRYAYVSFINSDWVQKIDTRTDQVIDEINLGPVAPPSTLDGAYNVLHLSPDGERFVVTNWKGDGDVIVVKTDDMTVERHFGGNGAFVYPHGVVAVPTFDTFFVTAEFGNVVYKFSANGVLNEKVVINDKPAVTQPSADPGNPNPDPHEIIFSPDRSKYFLTCQGTHEVRVIDTRTNALLAAIPVGTKPLEMDISRTQPYLFVTCQEDANSMDKMKGSVYVINYNTLQTVAEIKNRPLSQPHGVAVDDRNGMFYIASRNASANGPAPHHAAACNGRNGWYSVYSLSTLAPANGKRYEVSVEPYSMDARFKTGN